MVFFVVIINLLITLFNIYLAIKIWQLRKIISSVGSAIEQLEIYLSRILYITPDIIFQKKTNLYHFRQSYQLLELQLQKTRQIILLLIWTYRGWRRYLN